MSESKSTRISGTKEWSVASVNCVLGCPHRCRYCYARARAVQYGQCPSLEAWGTTYHRLRDGEVKKRRSKVDGRIMFPTTHDITPEFLGPCLEVLTNLLKSGNDVLIVSKPHWSCVKAVCDRFRMFRDQILFRFTIGAKDDGILAYWEPGAPNFGERLASLKHAFDQGFATSVSCEPLLDASNMAELVECLAPYVTDSIWIGKMNEPRRRCGPDVDPIRLEAILSGQTDDAVQSIHGKLKDHPLIRWKESYKEVLGLELASTAGMDT